ncbi:MAG: hypothetical protein ACOY94_16710 [Bacillota bacterium]
MHHRRWLIGVALLTLTALGLLVLAPDKPPQPVMPKGWIQSGPFGVRVHRASLFTPETWHSEPMPTPLRIWVARNVPALAHLGPRISQINQPLPGSVALMHVTGPVRPGADRHWLELEDGILEVYGGGWTQMPGQPLELQLVFDIPEGAEPQALVVNLPGERIRLPITYR